MHVLLPLRTLLIGVALFDVKIFGELSENAHGDYITNAKIVDVKHVEQNTDDTDFTDGRGFARPRSVRPLKPSSDCI